MSIKTKENKSASKILEELYGPLTFGKMLWALRKSDDLSQVQFAKKLKISSQYLSDIENERRTVSPEKAYLFAKRLGYSAEQFVRLSLQDQIERAGISDLKISIVKRAG